MQRGDNLEISYRSRKIEKICTNVAAAEKAYGRKMAEKIQQRIDEIRASDTVEMLVQFHIGRCHPPFAKQEGRVCDGSCSTVQIGI